MNSAEISNEERESRTLDRFLATIKKKNNKNNKRLIEEEKRSFRIPDASFAKKRGRGNANDLRNPRTRLNETSPRVSSSWSSPSFMAKVPRPRESWN